MMRTDSGLREVGSEASEITYEQLRHNLGKDAQ